MPRFFREFAKFFLVPVAPLALAVLLAAMFFWWAAGVAPARGQDNSHPSECAALPEQSAEILAHYGLAVVQHLAMERAAAQQFMLDNGAGDDQRAGVARLVFWRIVALALVFPASGSGILSSCTHPIPGAYYASSCSCQPQSCEKSKENQYDREVVLCCRVSLVAVEVSLF